MSNNNINKGKVYYNPFKGDYNQTNQYRNPNRNQQNRNQQNRNPSRNLNRYPLNVDQFNRQKQFRNNDQFNQPKYDSYSNTIPPSRYIDIIFDSSDKPIDNVNENKLNQFGMDNIQSIEIFPINNKDNSNDFIGSLLKKILSKEPKQENKEEKVVSPEFVVDINKEYEEITKPIKTLDDLIELGKSYDPLTADKYSVNLKRLNKNILMKRIIMMSIKI